ncbi:hypothetical protein F5148DRAFT_222826 [Russula earlei]|uniref:Uncharacterized protein n=1 Tax=Russula earlei TaxID=71964 RepID=A0ACC0U5J3_9AGAM|nr:hypothetical protein F5148DRAFT_222826 [Russula earlei]
MNPRQPPFLRRSLHHGSGLGRSVHMYAAIRAPNPHTRYSDGKTRVASHVRNFGPLSCGRASHSEVVRSSPTLYRETRQHAGCLMMWDTSAAGTHGQPTGMLIRVLPTDGVVFTLMCVFLFFPFFFQISVCDSPVPSDLIFPEERGDDPLGVSTPPVSLSNLIS